MTNDSKTTDPRIEAAAAAMWEQRPMMRTKDGAPRPWDEVPARSYGARYRGQAQVALTAADAADPLRSDAFIVIEIPEEPNGDVVHDYTFSPFGNDSEEDPEWHRTMDGDWKGYKDGGKEYLSWPELVRRCGPLTVPDPLAAALSDPEGHALVQAIHDRKAEG